MRNILVTGASRGIGKVIASELNFNYNVFATARNEKLLKELDVTDYCVCDLSNIVDLSVLSDFIEKNNIDILINDAGEYIYNKIEDSNVEKLEEIFKINAIAPILLMSKVVPYMKKQKWGRIINIGSISGVMGEACASAYSATKASLIGLSKATALELAQDNITVNVINPGWVDTDLCNASIEESEFSQDEIIECVPQRRFVEPIEVANLVKYLISDEAKGITGQSINLCAGLSVGI
ncbi:MAG: SDR family NAD(P)-dependent oxidoreductase [Candidatus Gastranaerophilaceae bacterium]